MSNWHLCALFGLLYAICWWMSKAVQVRVNRFIDPAKAAGHAEETQMMLEPKPKSKPADVLRFTGST
jgi:hypothetical protein